MDHILALNPAGQELIQGNFSVWFREKEARDRREEAQNEKLKGEIRRLEQAARRTESWSDRVERSKYGSENSGLKVDRGFVGHKSAKMMKRSKSLENRQRSAIQEKSALLRDVEHADALKLAPKSFPGGRLLEGREVSVCYGGRPVCAPCTFQVEEGDRVALLGGNGTGKTSLLRLLMGEELEHTGLLRRGSGLVISYVPQRADHLSGLPADFARAQGVDRTQFFTILRKLDFSRALLERDMAGYSAGQKKKVLLAASLCQSAHLYIWDEPLNYIDLFSRIQQGEMKDFNIIVKADVQGSAEAVKSSLEKLSNDEVRVQVIHSGVGAINESDVMLAATSNAIIVGFNVRPDAAARDNAARSNVEIRMYRVIYDCINEIEAAMKGMLAPKFQEQIIGHVEIRQTFKVSKVGTVCGGYVTDGKIVRNSKVRVVRDNIVVFEGDLASLRRFKDDVKEVAAGYECGLQVDKYNDVKVGDVIEVYVMEEIKQ